MISNRNHNPILIYPFKSYSNVSFILSCAYFLNAFCVLHKALGIALLLKGTIQISLPYLVKGLGAGAKTLLQEKNQFRELMTGLLPVTSLIWRSWSHQIRIIFCFLCNVHSNTGISANAKGRKYCGFGYCSIKVWSGSDAAEQTIKQC